MQKLTRFAAALFLSILIPACGSEDSETGEKSITIWWAQWDPADGLQELGFLFERETGIKVTVHQIPWSSYQDQVFLKGYQALISPTLATNRIAADYDPTSDTVVINDVEVDPHVGWILTALWNLLNWNPVVAVPTGVASNQVPTVMSS